MNYMIKKTSPLPIEYQELEYIESTGTQFIDTGKKLTFNDIEIKAKISFDNMPSTEQHIISNQNSSSFGFVFGMYSSYLFAFSRSANVSEANATSSSFSGKVDLTIDTKYNSSIAKKQIQVNNTLYNEANFNAQINSSDSNIILFRSGEISGRYFTGKIHYLRFYENNVLKFNLIPCYRKADGEIGLYDLVNDVFYTNAGTGTFTKGNNVEPFQSIPIGVLKHKKTLNLLKLARTEWNSTSYQPTDLVTFDYDKLYYMASSGYIRPNPNNLDETITKSSVTFTQTSSSWWGIGFPFEVKPNTKYTISAKRNEGTNTKIMYALYDADGSFKSYAQLTTNTSILDISLTITTSANTKTMVIVVAGITQGNTVYAYDLQVEEGQTRTDFKPYGYEIGITYNGIKTYNE